MEYIVSGTRAKLAAARALGVALIGWVLRFNALQLIDSVGVGIAAGAAAA